MEFVPAKISEGLFTSKMAHQTLVADALPGSEFLRKAPSSFLLQHKPTSGKKMHVVFLYISIYIYVYEYYKCIHMYIHM